MDDITKNFIKKIQQIDLFDSLLLSSQKHFHLHNIITSCGHEIVSDHNYSHDGLLRGEKPFAFLQYTLAGEGELNFEDKVYRLLPGQALLGIVPHQHQYYLPKDSSSWEFVYITFAGSEAVRILKNIQKTLGPVFPLSSIDTLYLFEKIISLSQKKQENIFTLSGLGYSFLMSLLNQIYKEEISSQNPKVLKAMDFCHQNYHKPILISHVSKHVNLSPYYFARIFNEETGTTIQKYLESYRIQKALEKIIESNDSIKNIAFKCGFSTSAYFTRVFKKYYGENPSLYQRQIHK